MSKQSSYPDRQLDRAAHRASRLLGPVVPGQDGIAAEAAGRRRGPPDAEDATSIARILGRTSATRLATTMVGDASAALAAALVAQATSAMAELLDGKPAGAIGHREASALEAVMKVRGRPALRVEADRLEPLDHDLHPGSDFWRAFVDDHEAAMTGVASSTGAVRVAYRDGRREPWVQGTAWATGEGCVVTNRHVLLPPEGERLARRRHGTGSKAELKTSVEVSVDFAFDDGPARARQVRVAEVVFVAEDDDPVDVAVVRLACPPSFIPPPPLALATSATIRKQLYVVGHPGRLTLVPPEVQAVFGSPDGRKRISFGEAMEVVDAGPGQFSHDASTIGGYSGGCVLDFFSCRVVGLHFYGDIASGNLAVKAAALRAHPVAAYLGS